MSELLKQNVQLCWVTDITDAEMFARVKMLHSAALAGVDKLIGH